MNSKCQSLFLLASLGLLSACSQQYAAPAANGVAVDGRNESILDYIGGVDNSGVVTERTEVTEYRYGNANNGSGISGSTNNGGGYSSGISSSDINTQGYNGSNVVGYNQYDADARRQQQLAAQRARQQQLAAQERRARQQQLAAQRAAQERARQQQLAAQRAAQERARQQQYAQNGSNGQYGQYTGSTYGASNGRNDGYGAGNTNRQYGGTGSQYSAADLKNPASLLSKRIIYFDYDQSSIKPQYMAILDAHASYLRSRANASIRLEGHADDRGSREYNLALSERRARAVRDYLSVKGISAGRMTVVGYGEEIPVKLGENEQSWSQNRRVEIKYSGE